MRPALLFLVICTFVGCGGGSAGLTLTSGEANDGLPRVINVQPGTGPVAGGIPVTIGGLNFKQGASVSFGEKTARVTAINSAGTTIQAVAPPHAEGAVDIIVTNPGPKLAKLSGAFMYVSPDSAPAVTSVLPNSGPAAGGTPVTITGSGFRAGANVEFGDVAASAVVVSGATQIQAVTPPHAAGTVPVRITNPDAQSSTLADAFEFKTSPIVTTLSATSGPATGGTSLTISGANFAPGAIVTFGQTPAALASVLSGTAIVVETPAHPTGTVGVSVRNPNGEEGTLADAFIFELAIESSSLPDGHPGVPYKASLTAPQATAPLTWHIDSGKLPDGLSLDPNSGIISGKPAALGQSSFVVRVTDSASPNPQTATKTLTVNVVRATYYGAAFEAASLNNTEIGKYVGRLASYRFQCTHTGSVLGVRLYIVPRSVTRPGYWLGTGGQLRVDLQSDDGTSNHLPSGQILATRTITNPIDLGWNLLVTFEAPYTLTEGKLYHLVFSNVDPDPVNNWCSIDNLFGPIDSPDVHPGLTEDEMLQLVKHNSTNPWTKHYRNIPIYSLYYADGARDGQGYMDVRRSPGAFIQGANKVREAFTVSGGDKTVVQATVYLLKQGYPGDLTLRLTAADGTLIEAGTLPASALGTSWATYDFSQPHTLKMGSSYRLELSAPAGDAYEAPPLQAGGGPKSSYGLDTPRVFGDGHLEITTDGTNWQDYLPKREDITMQFYFTLQ